VCANTSALHDTLAERVAAHDHSGALAAALSAVHAGDLSIPDLYDLLCELLAGVGRSWQAGETEVWQEHFATAAVRMIIEACHPLVMERASAPNGHVVVLATPPEEYHDLGLRMISDRFELAGWTTHLLGASLPAHQLIRAVVALAADAVVLSASTHYHRVALGSYVQELQRTHPELHIWVGGAAFAVEADGWPAEMVLASADIPLLAGRVG